MSDKALMAAWLHRVGDARVSGGDRTGIAFLFKAWISKPEDIRYGVKFLLSLLGWRRFYSPLKSWFRSI